MINGVRHCIVIATQTRRNILWSLTVMVIFLLFSSSLLTVLSKTYKKGQQGKIWILIVLHVYSLVFSYHMSVWRNTLCMILYKYVIDCMINCSELSQQKKTTVLWKRAHQNAWVYSFGLFELSSRLCDGGLIGWLHRGSRQFLIEENILQAYGSCQTLS